MAAVEWYVGMRVEYHSASYNEWIDCKIGAVRPDGCLKLEHADGSGVLKESADPSRVRPHAEEAKKKANGDPGSVVGAAAPPLPRAGSARTPPSAVPKKAGLPVRAPSPGPGGSPAAGRFTPKAGGATPRGGAPHSARGAGAGGNALAGAAAKSLDGTLSPKSLYVGDRVRLKGSSRSGEVMYIGPAQFANGEVVVGIKLDDKRTTSDCDGKHKGERYFRCTAGHGVYQSLDEVELVPPELADEEVRSLLIQPAPDLETFDLEEELNALIGLKEVKDSIRHARNFIEVQRRRCQVTGDNNAKALHFGFFQGGPGSGTSAAARLLAGMLLKLGVITKGHVVEATRKDLLAGCSSSEVEGRLKKVMRAAEGGLLVLHDVDSLKDGDRPAEELLQNLCKQFESSGGTVEWPQKLCLVACGKRGELQKMLADHPSLGGAVFARLEFLDLTSQEIAAILRKLVEENKFQLHQDLDESKLDAIVKRRMANSSGGNAPRNVRLARTMLEEAISRQTDRVYAKETLSYAGLTTLVEQDFADRSAEVNEEAQAALKRLDAIVGLKPVKEFVHSLHAQLLLEQQKREMGIDTRGSGATLHMVFTGNPGTGKTTVARVVADLLKALGLLRTGHLVEADRSALVAGYSGQTALKTKAVVESALGGVLFVDEAYALVGEEGKDSFGREALDTLIKMVEDYRSDLVVVLAGYNREMEKLFEANPGLRSRFPTVLEFDDYSAEELLEISGQMLLQDVMMLSQAAEERLRGILRSLASAAAAASKASASGRASSKDPKVDPRANGNGRAVRNIIERAKRNQAVRLQQMGGGRRSQEELCTLLPEDFDGVTG